MNSQEERELFESYGWEYNYVERYYEAPVKGWTGESVRISLDELVAFTTQGENGEWQLRHVVAQFGKRP